MSTPHTAKEAKGGGLYSGAPGGAAVALAGAPGAADVAGGARSLTEIYNRRKLMDLARSQAQDLAILRQEVQRLRLKTYPSFPA